MQNNILIVEDDTNLGFLLSEYLDSEGYHTELAKDSKEAWSSLNKNQYDLCVLDVMMPEVDGFMLAERIRSKYEDTPFLFLTAKIMREDRIKGLRLGAEDYITKPFDETELLLRIQNILRRRSAQEVAEVNANNTGKLSIGKYLFDPNMHTLHFGNQTYSLTGKENQVLQLLYQYKNQVLSREKALKLLYGEADYFLGRSFDVFICKLRKVLQEDPRVQIKNIYKVGFSLQVPTN